jgi:UDP-N-acetylglucosamine 3-dehydrogenase
VSDLHVLFVGCGRATQLHSRTLSRIAPDTCRYYASRSGEKACVFHQRYNGAGWFNSYEAALADERMHLALIATPPSTHLALTLAALRAGKHVIVEKPAFLTIDEFDTVALAAETAGRHVFVAENYYYKPIAAALRQVIGNGEIGELRLLVVNALKWQRAAGWRADPLLAGGGPLFEGGIHWISLLANLGLAVTSIDTSECGSPLTTVTRLQYSNSALAILAYSWEVRSRLRGLRVSRAYGTRGSIVFESNGLFLNVRGRTSRWFVELRDLAGYRAMFSDFLASVSTGRRPQFTLAQARRDVMLLRQALTNDTARVAACTM